MNRLKAKPADDAPEPKVPADLRRALSAAPATTALWKALTPIARRDFIMWIDAAKQAETRRSRIARTCSMLADGKKRPCCFSIVPLDLHKALAATPNAKAQWSGLSATQKRDLIGWIDDAEHKDQRKARIEEACVKLVGAKRRLGLVFQHTESAHDLWCADFSSSPYFFAARAPTTRRTPQ
jgi:uncharacterized protein YdeI (YjbR/CyaY-like superfamily)